MKTTSCPQQMDLFGSVIEAYIQSDSIPLNNTDLYSFVQSKLKISKNAMEQREPIGKAGTLHSPLKRKIRWYQQTLKKLGVIKKGKGERGVWELSEQVRGGLNQAKPGVKLVAFSTSLGLAIWSSHEDVFKSGFDDEISLIFTSPPYPLRTERFYGGPGAGDYSSFICNSIEPLLKILRPGGSVVLQISQDIFEPKSPSRSVYIEKLIIALTEKMGLFLMDRIPWVNYSKPPGPTYWACVNRVQLSSAYEFILWFTNDPTRVRSDNRRVLAPHSENQKKLIARGGEQRTASYGDGSYRLRHGDFSRKTEGSIPRNVFEKGHNCLDTRLYRKVTQELGVPPHGAVFPTALPDFFIRFLTEPEDLVVDHFAGTGKTALAAQRNSRRWVITERIFEYLFGASRLFSGFDGFKCCL